MTVLNNRANPPPRPISTAMVLAAGFGTRMGALSKQTPKPLIKVAGKCLIDYALDRLAHYGVNTAVVNVHYLADQIEQHVLTRQHPHIAISDERGEILETGGGLIKARALLGHEPIFCTNTDAILQDSDKEACQQLSDFWDDKKMDAALLLVPLAQASGYAGNGDFTINPQAQLDWPHSHPHANRYIFTGLQIIHPRLFAQEPLEKKSTRLFWEKAMANGRLYGVVYDGFWMHVGDPEGLALAERRLAHT
ncbi:MAG: nucleotidyltransferase family protein [bacterium]